MKARANLNRQPCLHHHHLSSSALQPTRGLDAVNPGGGHAARPYDNRHVSFCYYYGKYGLILWPKIDKAQLSISANR